MLWSDPDYFGCKKNTLEPIAQTVLIDPCKRSRVDCFERFSRVLEYTEKWNVVSHTSKCDCINTQDQFENIALHTQHGIDFCERVGNFLKERCNIENEYAAKLKYVIAIFLTLIFSVSWFFFFVMLKISETMHHGLMSGCGLGTLGLLWVTIFNPAPSPTHTTAIGVVISCREWLPLFSNIHKLSSLVCV